MHAYNTVALSVAPKRAALAAARATLDKTLAELAAAQVRTLAADGYVPCAAALTAQPLRVQSQRPHPTCAVYTRRAPCPLSCIAAPPPTSQARLAAVEAKIASLEAAFEEATAKKASLAAQVEDCRVRLARADKLIGGLGGERARWQARGGLEEAEGDGAAPAGWLSGGLLVLVHGIAA